MHDLTPRNTRNRRSADCQRRRLLRSRIPGARRRGLPSPRHRHPRQPLALRKQLTVLPAAIPPIALPARDPQRPRRLQLVHTADHRLAPRADDSDSATTQAVVGAAAALDSTSAAAPTLHPVHSKPTGSPAAFLTRIVRLLTANRYAEAWPSLNPLQQSVAPLQTYVACESQSPIPGHLVSLRLLHVRHEPVQVLPESAPVASTAVTFALRIADTAAAQQAVRIVLTAHAVAVDSRWTWILPPARLQLYREGCGSAPAPAAHQQQKVDLTVFRTIAPRPVGQRTSQGITTTSQANPAIQGAPKNEPPFTRPATVVVSSSPAAHATPRGKDGLLLFLRPVGGQSQIFAARADGTHIKQLTHLTDSGAADAAWSADGKRIAFARDYNVGKPTEHLDIYTMNADGTNLRGMGLKGLNGSPIWFPDGKRLLFGRIGGVWVIPATGGTPQRKLKIAGDFEAPALSPDGRQVAFIRHKGSKSDLVVATLSSGRLKAVTPWSVGALPKIDWSPDGSLLVSRNDEGVFTVKSDGSNLTMLVKGSDLCSESFSPDGTKVLYVDHCSTGGVSSHLLTVNLDGTSVMRIPGLRGHWVSWAAR